MWYGSLILRRTRFRVPFKKPTEMFDKQLNKFRLSILRNIGGQSDEILQAQSFSNIDIERESVRKLIF